MPTLKASQHSYEDAGSARVRSREANPGHHGLRAPLHQILLKMHRAFIRLDDGRHRAVRHGKNARLHPERGSNRFRCLGQSLPFFEQRAAVWQNATGPDARFVTLEAVAELRYWQNGSVRAEIREEPQPSAPVPVPA